MVTLVELLKLAFELTRELRPLAKALWRSRKVRKLVGGHLGRTGTAASEIEFLLVALEDGRIFSGETRFEALLAIRAALWRVYNELLDLVAEAQVVLGRDSLETKAAMMRLVARKGKSALPVFEALVSNAHAEENARDEARKWMSELKSASG